MTVELELKIYAYTVFIIILMFAISYIRWLLIDGMYYFKHHLENCLFGMTALVLSFLFPTWIGIRLIVLIAIWWFYIK